MTVDSACDVVLARNGKPFRRRHLDATVARVAAHGITLELGLIFGMPGETEETLAETVAWVHGLPASVEVVYAAGARVYPGTPLAAAAAAEPERVLRVGEGPLDPVAYCALGAPRALARRLHELLGTRPHTDLLGVGYRRASRAPSEAYRVVRPEATARPGSASSTACIDRRRRRGCAARSCRSRSGTGATTSRCRRSTPCSRPATAMPGS